MTSPLIGIIRKVTLKVMKMSTEENSNAINVQNVSAKKGISKGIFHLRMKESISNVLTVQKALVPKAI